MNYDSPEADMSFLDKSTGELFQFLEKVDPVSAQRFHPSDRRKIQSKVEIYLRTGRPASELYKEQKESGVDVRWDTLIFWVWSERDALNERLDKRVDKMIEMGVEDECRELYSVAERTKAPVTSGIFQAIGIYLKKLKMLILGYREFVPVIEARAEDDVDALRKEAIQQMKTHTRQYVRSQLSWINNKLIPLCGQQTSRTPIYILNATDPTTWTTKVLRPALSIVQGPPPSLFPHLTLAFQNGAELPSPSTIFDRADELLNPTRKISPPDEWKHWLCELCKDRKNSAGFVVVGGDAEWNAHLQTRVHRNRLRRLKKKEAFDEWKAKQQQHIQKE